MVEEHAIIKPACFVDSINDNSLIMVVMISPTGHTVYISSKGGLATR